MKPVIYYTIVTSRFGLRHSVFAVTSESARGRIDGRYSDGFSSHVRASHCFGKFETFKAAQEKVEIVNKLRAKCDAEQVPLQNQINALYRQCQDEIEKVLKS